MKVLCWSILLLLSFHKVHSSPTCIDGGDQYTCAKIYDGTIQCWGENGSGQLGIGNNTDSNVPVEVTNINNAIDISTSYHSCAILQNNSITCWGENDYGQLGDESTTNSNIPVPSTFGINNAIDISTGSGFTCVVLADNSIKCWGRNQFGQLGNVNTADDSNTPINVTGINNAIAISAGSRHTCSILSDNSTKCWGDGSYGQLGHGSTSGSSSPVLVNNIDNSAVSIASGTYHTCALLSNGEVNCWGYNYFGQLGDGTYNNKNQPTNCFINNAIAISAGEGHTCAIVTGGAVKCWGANSEGQLGNDNNVRSNIPVDVHNINDAIEITAGARHTCVLLSDNTMKCWGKNDRGQLGNSANTGENTAVEVYNLRDVCEPSPPTQNPTPSPTKSPTTGAPTTSPTTSPTYSSSDKNTILNDPQVVKIIKYTGFTLLGIDGLCVVYFGYSWIAGYASTGATIYNNLVY